MFFTILNLFIGSKIARITAGVLVVIGGIWGYGLQKKHEGKVELTQQSEVEGAKKNAEAKKARDRVNTDDKYFNKRLQRYCSDCKG